MIDDPVHGYGLNTADRWGGWTWREPARGEHFRRCSFCGSVHPEDLAAELDWRAEWADRKYGWPHKFYVDIPNRDPEALFVVGTYSAPRGSDRAPTFGGPYQLWDELTGELQAVVRRDGHDPERDGPDRPTWYQFGTRAAHFGKFYTAHLADPAIPAEAREVVEVRSGLRFAFSATGHVTWTPVGAAGTGGR